MAETQRFIALVNYVHEGETIAPGEPVELPVGTELADERVAALLHQKVLVVDDGKQAGRRRQVSR